MIACDKICKPKYEGGLRIRKIEEHGMFSEIGFQNSNCKNNTYLFQIKKTSTASNAWKTFSIIGTFLGMALCGS